MDGRTEPWLGQFNVIVNFLVLWLIIIIIYLICQMAANSKIHNEHKSQ